MKYTLFIFNMLFLLAGLALIIVGAIVQVQTSKSGFSDHGSGAGIFIIVIGSVVFLICFFGCAGAINNNHCMVVTYGVLLLVILLAQVAAIITGFVLKDKLTTEIKEILAKAVVDYDPKKVLTTKTWDQTQRALQCCGTTNYSSWSNNTFLNQTHSVPDTCCSNANYTENCGKGQNIPIPTEPLFTKGCTQAIEDILKTSMIAVGAIAAAVGLLEILGIIFAFCLANCLRKDYRVV